jgi:hypothetical protein
LIGTPVTILLNKRDDDTEPVDEEIKKTFKKIIAEKLLGYGESNVLDISAKGG